MRLIADVNALIEIPRKGNKVKPLNSGALDKL